MKHKSIVLSFLLAVLLLMAVQPFSAPAAPLKTVVFKIPLSAAGG